MTEKAHATWSASATSRNWNCAGALALGQRVAHLDTSSEAADWGTACHALAEKCLRTGLDAADRIGETYKTKTRSFDVDDEMAECAQVYIDYVRSAVAAQAASNTLHVEQRFTLDKLSPPFDAGGTADAVVYSPDARTLEVIDLKGGRGVVVEVTENKQLRTYALGAMLANPGLDVEYVVSTIVQPRAPHKDGRIRSEKFHVTELMDWTNELVAKMHRSAEAMAEYGKLTGDLTRDAWASTFLAAGDHCTFCPAAGFCPALSKKATDAAGLWFDGAGAPQIRNQPDDLSPEKLAETLDVADLIGNWLNAVRALATQLAESGTEIPGYHLADKFGHRKFKDADTAPAALELLGLPAEQIYAAPKLKSPAQIEKAFGAKRLRAVEDQFKTLYETPLTGRTLVSSAKSAKPAVKSAAERFFA